MNEQEASPEDWSENGPVKGNLTYQQALGLLIGDGYKRGEQGFEAAFADRFIDLGEGRYHDRDPEVSGNQ